jgi:hypothetical protein
VSLLSGPVVFIDDEIEDPDSQAFALLNEIRSTGRPVAVARAVPNNPDEWLDHWQSVAFVVLDWDLSPGSGGSTGAGTLSEFARKKLFNFVEALLLKIFCPIFIISAEDTDDISRQLSANAALMDQSGHLDGRIAVFPKAILMDKLLDHLTGWVAASPALSALKAWEREYDSAKNKLFIDLNRLEPDWPVYVWQAADLDEVDPSFELASVISTNLQNRFNPVVFDVAAITSYTGTISAESRLKVAEGRTVLPAEALSEKMVLPGDLFRFVDLATDPDSGEIWINVSPACHTIGRKKKNLDGTPKLDKNGDVEREPIRLHLLRGRRHPQPKTAKEWNALDRMRMQTNSILVHSIIDGFPYEFSFGDAQILEWHAISEFRIGRLLQPFVTRAQQMHAAYIQLEGLPRVTSELYGIVPASN